MITKHSIDLTKINEPCFALTKVRTCKVYGFPERNCNSYRCPFYKPQNCKSWIRIEDNTGINLIPPEEAFRGEKK